LFGLKRDHVLLTVKEDAEKVLLLIHDIKFNPAILQKITDEIEDYSNAVDEELVKLNTMKIESVKYL